MNGATPRAGSAVERAPARRRIRLPLAAQSLCALHHRIRVATTHAVLALLAFPGLAAHAAAEADSPWSLTTHPARLRVTAERVKLPGDERMGLVGTSYLVEFAPGWSVGPAAYGAITGERGGLFTLGGELSHYRRLGGSLGVEMGLYAGGGGGGSAPVGSGLMLRPHIDLLWDFAGQRAGLSLSRVRFSEGRIDSTQVGVVWSLGTDFRHLEPPPPGERIWLLPRTGVGFDRVRGVLGFYLPSSGTRRVDGTALEGRIGFAGARFERSMGNGLFWGLEAAGAASGGVAGYAEYLGTFGVEGAVLRNRLDLGARVAVGMGGGGEVDVGGGALLKAALYGTLHLPGDLGWTFELGRARAPQGSFRADSVSTSLTWVLDDRRASIMPATAVRTEVVGGVERYPAVRRDGSVRDLSAVTIKVNRFISDRVYVSGQAHSAIVGGAGGYSVGLLGLGFQQRWSGGWHAGVEALAGAAGGGGVDTAGGLILQPMAYVGWEIQPDLALRVGGGRIDALRGPLQGTVTEVSLAYSFGVGRRGGR